MDHDDMRQLNHAVNDNCECGGKGPDDGCPACRVWHAMQPHVGRYLGQAGIGGVPPRGRCAICSLGPCDKKPGAKCALGGMPISPDDVTYVINETELVGEPGYRRPISEELRGVLAKLKKLGKALAPKPESETE